MKKLVLIVSAILIAGLTFGQTIKKGSVVIVSSYEVTLNPDVTMNQFLDFYINKYIPEVEKNYTGVKEYILWGDRGEKKNTIGSLMVCESLAVRDKYWPAENSETISEAVKIAEEKMKAINEEMGKFVIAGKRTYTDWIVK
jgi:hypothetical protein